MKIRIFQIGGGHYDKALVGIAHDTNTMRALIELVERRGASGVSLHGTLPHVREAVSGDFTIAEAKQEYCKAVDAVTAFIMDGMSPDFAMMDMD